MGRQKREEWTTGKVFGVGMVFMFCAFLVFMGPLQWAYETYGPEWMRAEPEGLPEGAERVDLYLTMQEAIGGADADEVVRVYDANMVFLEESGTFTNGKATLGRSYWEGETINLQVRPADPNSASYDHYAMPMTPIVIPQADAQGDSIVAVPNVWKTSTAVVTFSATNQTNQAITGAAPNSLTVGDTRLNVYTVIADNSAYGTPFDFEDEKAGYAYKAGAWMVLKCNAEQDITTPHILLTGIDYWYYVFVQPMGIEDAVKASNTIELSWIIKWATGGAAAATTVTIDIFDTCRLDSSGAIQISSFLDGDSDFNPAVITTAITVGT